MFAINESINDRSNLARWYPWVASLQRRLFFMLGVFWGLATLSGLLWSSRLGIILVLVGSAVVIVFLRGLKVVLSRPVFWLGIPLAFIFLVEVFQPPTTFPVLFHGVSQAKCQDFNVLLWALLGLGGLFRLCRREAKGCHDGSSAADRELARKFSWIVGVLVGVCFLGICIWCEAGAHNQLPRMIGQPFLVEFGFLSSLFGFIFFSAIRVSLKYLIFIEETIGRLLNPVLVGDLEDPQA